MMLSRSCKRGKLLCDKKKENIPYTWREEKNMIGMKENRKKCPKQVKKLKENLQTVQSGLHILQSQARKVLKDTLYGQGAHNWCFNLLSPLQN